MVNKKCVIFDMDGVIVDTEPVHFEAMSKVLKKYNATLPENLFRTFVGKRATECFGILKLHYSIPEEIDQLIIKHDEWYSSILKEKIQQKILLPTKGLVNLLKELKQYDFLAGLVSSSPRWQVKFILESFDLSNYFQATIAGDEVKDGKPNPEGFLFCARKLSVSPESCVVIEDSPLGIEAATRCSMKAIALASSYFNIEALSKANCIIKGFEEISPQKISSILELE